MTPAEAQEVVKSWDAPQGYLACAECLGELLDLGAVRDTTPRIGSLLDRCEVHPVPNLSVHAMHVVLVQPSVVKRFRETYGDDFEPVIDTDEIVKVASRVYGSFAHLPHEHEAVAASVRVARAICRTARGI